MGQWWVPASHAKSSGLHSPWRRITYCISLWNYKYHERTKLPNPDGGTDQYTAGKCYFNNRGQWITGKETIHTDKPHDFSSQEHQNGSKGNPQLILMHHKREDNWEPGRNEWKPRGDNSRTTCLLQSQDFLLAVSRQEVRGTVSPLPWTSSVIQEPLRNTRTTTRLWSFSKLSSHWHHKDIEVID